MQIDDGQIDDGQIDDGHDAVTQDGGAPDDDARAIDARDDRPHEGQRSPTRDDDLADALEAESLQELAQDPDDRSRAGRRWWPLYAVGILVMVVAVVLVLAWPRDDAPSGTASPTTSTSADLAGADLLTAPWPSNAVTALGRDVGLTKVSRLLLTREQVQATGPASEKSTGSTAWSDYVYVEDTAVDLGDALVPPSDDELFALDSFDASAIPTLVADAPGLTGTTDATSVYVIVERDTVTEGAPVRISVYLAGGKESHVVTADAHGSVLSTD